MSTGRSDGHEKRVDTAVLCLRLNELSFVDGRKGRACVWMVGGIAGCCSHGGVALVCLPASLSPSPRKAIDGDRWVDTPTPSRASETCDCTRALRKRHHSSSVDRSGNRILGHESSAEVETRVGKSLDLQDGLRLTLLRWKSRRL